MGTKNNPGRFDCYAAAAPDEPYFVLLGRDRHAGLLVRIWALLRELEGEPADSVAEARASATLMAQWLHDMGRPTLPAGVVPKILGDVKRRMAAGAEAPELDV